MANSTSPSLERKITGFHERPILVGDIAESLLPEIRYQRITDRMGSSVRGGDKPPHPILALDALRYKPLACQWAGIKSLDPIPGGGSDLFFRFTIIAELYSTPEMARQRDAEFESVYSEHVSRAGNDPESVSKRVIPVLHLTHDRVFYLLTTDMAASSDPNEAGKLKFGIMRHLTQ